MGLRENLCRDTLSHLAFREPLVLAPGTPVREAVDAMQRHKIGCALICAADELVGIFTERDLMRRVLLGRARPDEPVERFMTPHPVTLRESDPVAFAIRIMFQGHYRHLPLMNDRNVPIGVVSVKHIVAYLVDYHPSAVYNLPPQPRQAQETREGA